MDLCLSSNSTFAGSKFPLTSTHPIKQGFQPKFNIISCRATKVGSNKNATTNLYNVLSLDAENVSADEIKKAYRTKALQYHPDVCHPSRKDESARLFVELHKAYKVLSDPISRRKYDYELGLISQSGRTYNNNDQTGYDYDDNGMSRDRWIEQLFELKRRSEHRMSRTAEDSWRCSWKAAQHN